MAKQNSWLYSLLINMNERCNEFLPAFSSFNNEFSLGNRLINSFSDQFSFHNQTHDIKSYMQNLDTITIEASNNLYFSIIIADTSIQNNVATSISHIHSHNSPVIKTIHQVINVTSTEAKLFAIRYGINQAVSILNINWIIVITDFLHMAKKFFDSSLHPYQI